MIDYQTTVARWVVEAFGQAIASDTVERNFRFLEEALELVQAKGCTATEAHALVDYVYGRDVGHPPQEVGGVMVTLAALCQAACIDLNEEAWRELERIDQPDVMERIRAKQAAKSIRSATATYRDPLPGQAVETPPEGA